MPQHSNIRRSPKKHNFTKASSNPAIWSRSQQDWNEIASPRSNNAHTFNSPYKQTTNKSKQRSIDLEEGSNRGFVSPPGGNFETVIKRKAGYNSTQNLAGSFTSHNDSGSEYSPSFHKIGQNSGANESQHSKHIHPVRKGMSFGILLMAFGQRVDEIVHRIG